MGLTVIAKGLSDENSYDCGYIHFMKFRMDVAKAYNEEYGELIGKWYMGNLKQEECDRLNSMDIDEGMDLLLQHSDCDGKFTPKECRKVYDAIKDLKMDMEGHNYGIMKPYNMLEQWKGIFKHCYKNRVNLYFY